MTIESYQYRQCGLDNIRLLNGFKVKRTKHGEAISIQDIDGLHHAIGKYLVREKKNLTGAEVRFLRHELGLSQKMLGMLLGKSEQTLARWEKGQSRIDGPADRLLRLLYQQQTGNDERVRKMLQHLADLDSLATEEVRFEDTRGGWRVHSAA